MSGLVHLRRQRIGPALARLLDGCPYATRAAALDYILQPRHARPTRSASRTLDLALRRGLVVELVDGRVVRASKGGQQ